MQYLGEYSGLAIMLALIIIPVLFVRTINKVIKIIVVVYYGVLTAVFIYGRRSISDKYETTPVPDIYWDKNSEWVGNLSLFYFIPLVVLILYIFYKWFFAVERTTSKILVTLAFIGIGSLYLFFLFIFNFAYGYRP